MHFREMCAKDGRGDELGNPLSTPTVGAGVAATLDATTRGAGMPFRGVAPLMPVLAFSFSVAAAGAEAETGLGSLTLLGAAMRLLRSGFAGSEADGGAVVLAVLGGVPAVAEGTGSFLLADLGMGMLFGVGTGVGLVAATFSSCTASGRREPLASRPLPGVPFVVRTRRTLGVEFLSAGVFALAFFVATGSGRLSSSGVAKLSASACCATMLSACS